MPRQRKRAQAAASRFKTGSLRAAIYARVSTAVQASEGTSLDSQLAACADCCTRNGWVSLPDPFVDGGVSGALDSRPQLDALVALADRGEIDVLVVSKLDRLGRSLVHLLTLVQRLDELGVRVVSVSDGVDTATDTGRLLLGILGLLAEYERNRIRERTLEGLHRRASEGVYVSSVPPYGYRRVGKGRDSRLEIIPDQAQAIRYVYDNLIVGKSTMADVVRALNAAGLTTHHGERWNVSRLSRWIRGSVTSTAAGIWQYGDARVEVPAILEQHEANAWAAWLDDRDARRPVRKAKYLLSGMIAMPCGSTATGRFPQTAARAQSPIYACLNHLQRRSSDPDQCNCRNVLVDALDEAVWSEIAKALTDSTALAALAVDTDVLDIGGGTIEARLAETTAALAQLRDRAAEEYKALRLDGFDPETAREFVAYSKDEIARLDTERGRLSLALAQTRQSSGAEAREAAERVAQAITKLDADGRRKVLVAAGTQVAITGWEECSQCGGRGYAGRGSDRTPAPCPTCCRMKYLPLVEVAVTLPEALLGVRANLAEAV